MTQMRVRFNNIRRLKHEFSKSVEHLGDGGGFIIPLALLLEAEELPGEEKKKPCRTTESTA